MIGLSGGALFTAIVGALGLKFAWEVGLRYDNFFVLIFNPASYFNYLGLRIYSYFFLENDDA